MKEQTTAKENNLNNILWQMKEETVKVQLLQSGGEIKQNPPSNMKR